jgi:hypothetical protein
MFNLLWLWLPVLLYTCTSTWERRRRVTSSTGTSANLRMIQSDYQRRSRRTHALLRFPDRWSNVTERHAVCGIVLSLFVTVLIRHVASTRIVQPGLSEEWRRVPPTSNRKLETLTVASMCPWRITARVDCVSSSPEVGCRTLYVSFRLFSLLSSLIFRHF